MTIEKLLIVSFSIFFALSAAQAQFDPIDPTFEDQYIEVEDIIFSDAAGYIVYEANYLDGEAIIRRLRLVTRDGDEVLVITGVAGNSVAIYTPGDDIQITQLSQSQVRVNDLNSSASFTVNEPSGGWPDIVLPGLPGPSAQWQYDIEDLIQAYENETANEGMNSIDPITKYKGLGYNLMGEPPSCGSCGVAVTLATINIGLTVASCLATPYTFGMTVVACSLAWGTVGVTSGLAIRTCNCTPYGKMPINVTPTEPEDPPPSNCGPVCSNFDPAQPDDGTWHCLEWKRPRISLPDGTTWFEDPVCQRWTLIPG